MSTDFVDKRIEFVPSFGASKFVLGFDTQRGLNCLFVVRKCTEEEKRTARADLSMMSRSHFGLLTHTRSLQEMMSKF